MNFVNINDNVQYNLFWMTEDQYSPQCGSKGTSIFCLFWAVSRMVVFININIPNIGPKSILSPTFYCKNFENQEV